MKDYAGLSLWHGSAGNLAPRPPLDAAERARRWDVIIMGAGYTGLWTALGLLAQDPSRSILILEKEIAGFGASGRNGGWVSSLYPTSTTTLIDSYGSVAASALRTAMVESVASVGAWASSLDIECDFVQGGTTTLVRNEIHQVRAASALREAQLLGVDALEWRDPADTLRASETRGGVFDPACARVHPAKLVRGLAAAADNGGVRIAEATTVLAYRPGVVTTSSGDVSGEIVIDAMEGYRSQLRASKRSTLPLYSLMIATEPLPEKVFDDIGLEHGMTFADYRSLVIYGQRTFDNRIAFGGRGAPYHWGSRIDSRYDRDPRVFRALESTLKDMFPQLGRVGISHTWGGVLGVPRDWHSSVTFDSHTGLGAAGGYVGDGVALSHLSGLTLADAIMGKTTHRTALPFFGHHSPLWEPEPLRYLGATAAILGVGLADKIESKTGKTSLVSRLIAPLTGH